MSKYHNELKDVSREAPFTVWTLFKWGILLIVVISILTFFAQSLGIISINIKREVIQHSQQYVETKINLLNKLHSDWLKLQSEIIELRAIEGNEEIISAKIAQQRNIVQRMKTEAEMILSSQIPAPVRAFLSTH